MSVINRFVALVILSVVAHLSNGQTGNNVPRSPMWPIFSQLLASQTGRTLQDINALGLSDPTINQLWTSYSASLVRMSQTPAPATMTTTTPPPLPDLYQTSYSFSSSANQAAAAAANQAAQRQTSSTGGLKSSDNAMLYNDLVSLINRLSVPGSSGSNAPQSTSTSTQDVMNAYAQLSGSSLNANPIQAAMNQLSSSAGASSQGGTNYQALIQQYLSSTGGTGGDSLTNKQSSASGASSNSPTSYQALIDQYNSVMNQGNAGASANPAPSSSSYDQLLQQYNQIMGGKTLGTPASSGTSSSASSLSPMVDQYMASQKEAAAGTPNEKLVQMYAQMIGGNSAGSGSGSGVNAPPPTTSAPLSAQETFDKQLSTFFPQFKSLFPNSSPGNTSLPNTAAASSGQSPASSNTAQLIFDAILFAPTQTGGSASTNSTDTSTRTPPQVIVDNPQTGIVQTLANSRQGAAAALSNHVQNVFKTRASREMGCRFLPELLELDVLPTAPINCMNRCPFPYVNSQQYGIYCVCCPPGVNDQTVGMMSMVRGSSYMEAPLAVVS